MSTIFSDGFGVSGLAKLPTIPHLAAAAVDEEPTRVKVDRLVEQTRAAADPAAVNKRAVPRSSIGELNDLDIDELRDRFIRTRRDDRSPIVKVLDLLDLPRNALFNAMAPGLARRQAARGEKAAFGLGRVSSSDVLEELGVSNRTARAILGFVGDVALDPLTYVGPAGWGIEALSPAGKVAVRAGGKRALRRSIADVATGAKARDEVWGAYLAARGWTPETIKARGLTPRAATEEIRKAVHGDLTPSNVERLFSVVGGERSSRGGSFAADVTASGTREGDVAAAEAMRTAREVMKKYGRGTGPSLRIGTGGLPGSEVLHVPFTDWTVQVPGFTTAAANARRAATLHKFAKDGLAGTALKTVEGMQASKAEAKLNSLYTAHQEDAARMAEEEGIHAETVRALKNKPPPPPPAAGPAGGAPTPTPPTPGVPGGAANVADDGTGLPGAVSQRDAGSGGAAGGAAGAAGDQSGSVPFMITRKMEADLRGRGFTEAQINSMTPQQAWDHLNNKATATPATAPDAVAQTVGPGGHRARVLDEAAEAASNWSRQGIRSQMEAAASERGWSELRAHDRWDQVADAAYETGNMTESSFSLSPKAFKSLMHEGGFADWFRDPKNVHYRNILKSMVREGGQAEDFISQLPGSTDQFLEMFKEWVRTSGVRIGGKVPTKAKTAEEAAAKAAKLKAARQARKAEINGRTLSEWIDQNLGGDSRFAGRASGDRPAFLSWLWRNDDGGVKQVLNPAELQAGTKFTIAGHAAEVVADEDTGRLVLAVNPRMEAGFDALEAMPGEEVAKSLEYDFGAYLDELNELPVDEGSVTLPEYNAADDPFGFDPNSASAPQARGDEGSLPGTGGGYEAAGSPPVSGVVEAVPGGGATPPGSGGGPPAPPAGASPPPGGPPPDPIANEVTRMEAARADYRARQKARLDAARQVLQESRAALAAFTPNPADVGNVNDLLALGESLRAAQARVDHLQADVANPLDRALRNLDIDVDDPEHAAATFGEDIYHAIATDPQAVEQLQEMAHIRLAAARQHAEAITGYIDSVLTTEDRFMKDMAKQVLGISDDHIAVSLFGKLGDAIEDSRGDSKVVRALHEADRRWRKVFGVRGGLSDREFVRIRAQAKYAQDELARWGHRVSSSVQRVAKTHKVDADALGDLVLAKLYERSDPQGRLYFWEKFSDKGPGTGAPSDLRAALDDAQKAGMFANPAVLEDANKLADEFIDLIRSVGDSELQDELLGSLIEGYIPSTLTDEASKAVRLQKEMYPKLSEGAGVQQFQRARTTWQTRYLDPNIQKWRRFFGIDLAYIGKDDAYLKARFGARWQEMAEARDAADSFMKLSEADPTFRAQFPPRATDHRELNELFNQGRFQDLIGSSGRPESFFEGSLPLIMGSRMAAHQRAVSLRSMAKSVLGYARWLDPDAFERIAQSALGRDGTVKGKPLRLSNGVEVSTTEPAKTAAGGTAPQVRVGSERYRLLDPSLRSKLDNPIMAALGSASKTLSKHIDGMLLPSDLADKIEDVALTVAPGAVEKTLQTFDKLNGLWKMQVLTHPSWPVFNMVGNIWLALAGGARVDHIAEHAKDVFRIRTAMDDPAKLDNMVMTIAGQRLSGRQVMQMLLEHGAFNNNLSLEAAAQYYKDDPGILSRIDRLARRYLGPWFRANQVSDDISRGLAFISFLEQGYDLPMAEQKMLGAMFDFADFTKIEEKVFRRLIPFYSWLRTNGGYQLAQLAQRPGYAALPMKLQNTIEEAIAGESRVPENQRPGWMREALATQIGSDPKSRFAVMLGSNILPQNDVVRMLTPIFGEGGAQSFAHYFASNLAPVLAAPLEYAAGTEFFSGRTIGEGGDLSTREFFANQIRPIAEYGPGGRVWDAFGRGTGQGIARALVGGRVQAFDEERLATSREREVRDEEGKLRAAIRKAQRREDRSAELDARARLLRLYEDAQRAGMRVPKWAQAQLAEVGAGQ